MQPFRKLKGIAVPLDRSHVDTDQIIPKQFLKRVERTGFGQYLFFDWRYSDDAGKNKNPDFVLNKERYAGATVLLARENFGCGSSREHAPWALLDYGFRVVIAPSFADIFYNNCFQNGILPLRLKTGDVERLFRYVQENDRAEIEVDLEKGEIHFSGNSLSFEIDPFRRECMLNGWDDIGLTLRSEEKINEFERSYFKKYPFYNIK